MGKVVKGVLLGAVVGAATSYALFGIASGAHIPQGDAARAIGLEVALTFLLMLVIMSVATDRRAAATRPQPAEPSARGLRPALQLEHRPP